MESPSSGLPGEPPAQLAPSLCAIPPLDILDQVEGFSFGFLRQDPVELFVAHLLAVLDVRVWADRVRAGPCPLHKLGDPIVGALKHGLEAELPFKEVRPLETLHAPRDSIDRAVPPAFSLWAFSSLPCSLTSLTSYSSHTHVLQRRNHHLRNRLHLFRCHGASVHKNP